MKGRVGAVAFTFCGRGRREAAEGAVAVHSQRPDGRQNRAARVAAVKGVCAKPYPKILVGDLAFPRLQFYPAGVHIFVVIVDDIVATVAVKHSESVGHEIFLFRKEGSEGLAPNFHTYLSFRRESAGHLASFREKKLRIGCDLLKAKRRLVLSCLDLELRKSMPVDPDVSGSKRGPCGIRSQSASGRVTDGEGDVALLEFAFHLKIEILREVTRQIDSRSPEPKPIVDRAGAEASFKSEDVAGLILHLNKTAEHQLDLRTSRNDVNRFLLFAGFAFLDV